MTLNTQLRGATYARISLDRKGEELGVQRQGELTKKLAEARSIDVTGRQLVDNDVSAMKPNTYRAGYEQLLQLVRTDAVDVVIVYQSSRLWRNKRERLDGQELFRQHGVDVLCVRGLDLALGSASGRLMADVEGAVNAWESEVKAERMADEAQQAVQAGMPPKGPRAFGYSRNGWELVEDEADAVRLAFRMLLTGRSLRAIAQELNATGLRPAWRPRGDDEHAGNPWGPTSVRKVLRNVRYAAQRVRDGELYPGKWPEVVTLPTWEAAQRILDDDKRRSVQTNVRRWLGSGLYVCGACAATCVEETMTCTHGSTGKRVYRCRASAHVSRVAAPIDALVEGVVCERLSRPDAADLLLRRDGVDLEALRDEAQALRSRRMRIAALLGAGAMDDEQFKEANQEVRVLLDKVESQLHDADRAPVLAELIVAGDVRALWETYALDRKRAVVNVLLTVTIHKAGPGRREFRPDSIEIVWK